MAEITILENFFAKLADTIRVKAVFAEGEKDTFKPENIADIINSDRINPQINGKFKRELICYTPAGLLGIETVTFGSDVTTMGEAVYLNCANLTTVNALGYITTIQSKAFSGCTNLASIDLSKATSIGSNAFANCTALTELNVTDELVYVGQAALNTTGWYKAIKNGPAVAGRCLCGSNGVTEITITDKVLKCVVTGAFGSGSILQEITIRIDGTLYIQCFQANKNLTKVVLKQEGEEIVAIDTRAFDQCTNLEELSIDNAQSLSYSALNGCTNLKKVVIGKIPTIADNTFKDCKNLATLEIGNISELQLNAFQGCSSLTNIYIMNKEALPKEVFNALKRLPSYTAGKQVTLYVSSELREEWDNLLKGNDEDKLGDNFSITVG